jgi:hypothetical protein
MMSYIMLRGRWCNIIVVNVHAPCEDKSDNVKDSFYEKLGRVFDQLPRYDRKLFVEGFQRESRQGRYFQTDNWQRELKRNY